MNKAVVFISHIAEEKAIAQALKTLVESAFLGLIDVFVSSDSNSIKLGSKWLDNITAALKSCNVEIILASPSSIRRPWINFEAGAGWIRDIPVIPLCLSGMTVSTLPTPLKDLQAAIATDKEELAGLVPLLADAIGSVPPAIDWSNFIAAVKNYETNYQLESKQIDELAEKSLIPQTDGLETYELLTFLLIGENVEEINDCRSTWQIRDGMESLGYNKLATSLAMSSLIRKNLIASCAIPPDGYGEPIPGVTITDEGWLWLSKNRHLLKLTEPEAKEKSKKRGDRTSEERQTTGDDIPF